MKLGVVTSPKPEGFDYAKRLGLEFVEFCINVEQDVHAFAGTVKELKEASERTGVAVGSIGRWGVILIAKDGSVIEEELQAAYTLIDAASELGCPIFIAGCNYVEERSYLENVSSAIQFFSMLIEYGKVKGVRIATYNCDWNNFVYNDQAWRLIHGQLPELGIKYDPSHARYGGRDYLKEMKEWGSRFLHVHIKGSVIIDGKHFDDPPAGLDQTDWGTFMAILYGVGYNGGLSIEPHSEVWKGELGDKGVQFTVDYMKRLIFR
ncbi:sugar phosphate isomerase/epimerase [Paenibacillus aurantius]|uniref:Sugar phosphate isomerase/epimerase n=1 Tax=Paenibacillus aurantius TaxID=2918900 RepID=A0AA96LHI3_9BACL|nr:sugar phosphate isomerase/epimerase [Paenibacillus aurantius]WNQ13083.1 sugar phosphate isomerase/epimerase [Paenibacillus aurantius]